MKRALSLFIVVLLASRWGTPAVAAGVTNTLPWRDAFESYTNQTPITGTNGWSMSGVGTATVTSDPAVTGLLTNYPAGGRSYPLAGEAHSNVLEFTTVVRNEVGGNTGGVVKVDFLALPIWMEVPPTGDTNAQCSFCISTNGLLTIWHHNAAGDTNEWRELTNSPVIDSNVWSRFTIVSDYANRLFQVRINEGPVITDDAGWTSATGTQGGAWFRMVQTGGRLSGLKADGMPAYLDDVLVTNRTLTWSGSGFVERTLNDGRIDTGTPFTVTLAADTFKGADGDDLVAGGLAVASGVPGGLTAVVTRVSATQVQVTLAGIAAHHESVNTTAALGLEFTDAAFGFGSAWDVGGYRQTALTVTFSDTPCLTWSTNAFHEAAADDGTIDNANPLLIDLAHGTFSGTVGENLATNAGKLALSNVPAGLTLEAVLLSAVQVRVRLLGSATDHLAANSLSNLGLAFQDAAFTGVPASSVFNNATNLSAVFSDAGVVTYGTNVFREAAANNGTVVGGTTLALANRSFNATNGENLVASGKVTGANVPAGLALQVVATDGQHATLALAGTATAHAAANSIANLTVTFLDAAFLGGNALGVTNRARSDLAVVFLDQPVVSAVGGSVFAEAPANNGSIGNSLAIALTGDAFADTAWVANTHYTVANVPAGLTFALAYADASHLTATLSGNATAHVAANSIANLTVTFLDPAFGSVAAANVTGHPLVFAVAFSNAPTLSYSGDTFNEISGGVIDNRNPITITLAGEALAGSDGQDFVGAGWVEPANVPPGLSAKATRASATQLSVTLEGRATSHRTTANVYNMALTFTDAAFAHAQADQVAGYRKADLKVLFTNEAAFFNVMPYAEPFERYANGTVMNGTNGWTALYDACAASVTNDAVVSSNLAVYMETHSGYPVAGEHAQVLRVTDYVEDAIHSETTALVYVDFMAWPVPLQAAPDVDTNMQCSFYVSTNGQLVVWHRNTTGGSPVNEWLPLTNAPLIDTSRWFRLTIAQDYAHNLFQVQVNEGRPILDDRAWTQDGATRPGTWFRMVQTNGTMSGFRVSGVGEGCLDDLTVGPRLPDLFGSRAGAVFKFR